MTTKESQKRPARMRRRGAGRVSARPSSRAPRAVALGCALTKTRASKNRVVERQGVWGTPRMYMRT